jgi:hypothetical protein
VLQRKQFYIPVGNDSPTIAQVHEHQTTQHPSLLPSIDLVENKIKE